MAKDKVVFVTGGSRRIGANIAKYFHKKGFKIKEMPYIQNKDEDIINSKSASSLIKFSYLGFLYVIRIISTLMRRKN